MPVFIFDPDALARLTAAEGEAWLREQNAHPDSPYGFHAWLEAWQAKQRAVAENPEYLDEPVASLMNGGDGAMYGSGGWRRYRLTPQGEVVLLAWSAPPEQQRRVESCGFRVVG